MSSCETIVIFPFHLPWLFFLALGCSLYISNHVNHLGFSTQTKLNSNRLSIATFAHPVLLQSTTQTALKATSGCPLSAYRYWIFRTLSFFRHWKMQYIISECLNILDTCTPVHVKGRLCFIFPKSPGFHIVPVSTWESFRYFCLSSPLYFSLFLCFLQTYFSLCFYFAGR